jgi:hypothetical protein
MAIRENSSVFAHIDLEARDPVLVRRTARPGATARPSYAGQAIQKDLRASHCSGHSHFFLPKLLFLGRQKLS